MPGLHGTTAPNPPGTQAPSTPPTCQVLVSLAEARGKRRDLTEDAKQTLLPEPGGHSLRPRCLLQPSYRLLPLPQGWHQENLSAGGT